jgi:hypothetical protein
MADTFDYQAAISDADELIQFFGMNAVLRRTGIADRPCRVAILSYDPRDAKTDLTNPTDRRVVMSAANPEVQATPPNNELDQLVTFVQPPANPPVEDEVLPFTCPVKPTRPAGITVLYEFTVRQ